jgi:hypothetical protein
VLVGLAVGAVLAVVGEVGALVVRATSYMADVGIVGLTAVYGLPVSAAVGALLGWWGRPRRTRSLAAVAAVPAGLVAVAQVVLQANSV